MFKIIYWATTTTFLVYIKIEINSQLDRNDPHFTTGT